MHGCMPLGGFDTQVRLFNDFVTEKNVDYWRMGSGEASLTMPNLRSSSVNLVGGVPLCSARDVPRHNLGFGL